MNRALQKGCLKRYKWADKIVVEYYGNIAAIFFSLFSDSEIVKSGRLPPLSVQKHTDSFDKIKSEFNFRTENEETELGSDGVVSPSSEESMSPPLTGNKV